MKSVEIDRSKRLIDQPKTGHNRWHPDVTPILEADEGEEVVLETRDGVDGQLGPSTTAASMAGMDAGAIHPITGPVLEGIAKAGNGKTLADFDIVPYVRVAIGDDLTACRDKIRPQLALYIGGMGARSKNYYNDLAKRLGYEAAAVEIQDHFLAGRRKEAEAAVPDELIDETSLVGPKERIRDRLAAWEEVAKDHRVGTLLLVGATPEALRVVAEAVL